MVFRRIFILAVLTALLAALVPFSAATDDYKASTVEEFAGWVEYHASRLETSYQVPCEASLMEELKKKSPVDGKTTLLSELLIQFGTLGDYSVVWYGDRIGLENLKYYAGWRISRLQETGKTDLLTSREKETLGAALTVAEQASGSDLEKERFLFDALCGRITYDADPNDMDSDRDCAVGAFLNGRADCDGYADAMMLCCSLSGIPCRYIHGRAVDSPDGRDGSHMWNLVFIENMWLMCDVTWGDRESEEPAYLFFNIGSQDAAASYVWNPETLFTPVAGRADFSVHLPPDRQPVSVVLQEDVCRAVRTAVSAGLHHLMLYCPEEILWQTDPGAFRRMVAHGGAGTHSWRDSGRLYELYNIALPDSPFCFCDSREEVLSAVRRFAEQNTPAFSLYFHPSLSEELFADSHAGLQRLLAESLLEETGRYQYSEESGCVTLTDVSYIDELPSCSSAEDVAVLLRRRLPDQPVSLAFLLGDGLSFDDVREQIADTVYACGASSFGYLLSGGRVTLAGLEYFENYCLAESEADVISFMRTVRDSKAEEMRIYCSGELYASLCADHARLFFSLLKEAGFTDYSVYTTDEYCVFSVSGLR